MDPDWRCIYCISYWTWGIFHCYIGLPEGIFLYKNGDCQFDYQDHPSLKQNMAQDWPGVLESGWNIIGRVDPFASCLFLPRHVRFLSASVNKYQQHNMIVANGIELYMKFKCLSIMSIYYVQTKPIYVYSLYIVYFLGGTQFHILTWPCWVRKHGIFLCSIHFFELHFAWICTHVIDTSIFFIILYIYVYVCIYIYLCTHHKCHKCTILGRSIV